MAEVQLVTFTLGKAEYAIPIAQVRGILEYSEITRLSDSPPHMEGVAGNRDAVVSVIDLAGFLSIAQRGNAGKYALMMEVEGIEAAAMIDKVSEVVCLEESAIEPPPSSMDTGDYIAGIGKMGKRLLILLDAASLIRNGQSGHGGALN